jgi:hypothetical protein
MTTESRAAMKREPTFGMLSLTAPVIGGLIIFLLLGVFPSFPLSFILSLLIVPLTPICGAGFAVTALIRREKYWALPCVCLLLNLVIMYFVFGQMFGKDSHFIGSMG